MYLDPSPADFAVHKRAVERLRSHLFGVHSAQDCCVVTETILAPTVCEIFEVDGATKEATRELSLGGLALELEPMQDGGVLTVSIKHQQRTRFAVWVTNSKGGTAPYTVYSNSHEHRELPLVVWRVVQAVRESAHDHSDALGE